MPPTRRTRQQPLSHGRIVTTALGLLSRVGLPDLTMRELGAERGVQQSALYHHVANKQTLLGAVADAILARRPTRDTTDLELPWQEVVRQCCRDLHAAVTAYPDGADIVMSMWAFGMGGRAPFDELREILGATGLDARGAKTAARTLLHFVYGHAYDEQSHAQAARSGIASDARPESDFDTGLDIILTGVESLVVR